MHANGVEIGREYWYEVAYHPIPLTYWNQYTKVDVWKRRRANPSGAHPSSRMHRLDLTPPRFRDITWAAEHVVAYKSIRNKWSEIAVKLGLKFQDFHHLIGQDIGSDEKFCQVDIFHEFQNVNYNYTMSNCSITNVD